MNNKWIQFIRHIVFGTDLLHIFPGSELQLGLLFFRPFHTRTDAVLVVLIKPMNELTEWELCGKLRHQEGRR